MLDEDVFDAVRRGYADLEAASAEAIVEHFAAVDAASITGHANHVKGILFEQEYVDLLGSEGVQAEVFEMTNHPVTDISVMDGGTVVGEFQLKATDSVGYVDATMTEYPDVAVVTTSEVAASFDTALVTDSGIEDATLEQAVEDALFGEVVNPIGPLSVLGWCFGLL